MQAPLFDTTAMIMGEVKRFADIMVDAENAHVGEATLTYLIELNKVKSAYYQAAGSFAIAAAIQDAGKKTQVETILKA